MDQLLARLSEQQTLLKEQKQALTASEANSLGTSRQSSDTFSSASIAITPASDKYVTTPPSGSHDGSAETRDIEVQRLKRELEAAQHKIARLDQEMSQNRITKHTFDQAMGPPSEADFSLRADVSESTISRLQNAFNGSTRAPYARTDNWPGHEDARSDTSEALPMGAFNRNQGIWNHAARRGFGMNVTTPDQPYPLPLNNTNLGNTRPWFTNNTGCNVNSQGFGPHFLQRSGPPGPRVDTFRSNNQFMNEPAHFPMGQVPTLMNPPSRPSSTFDTRFNGWRSYAPTAMSTDTHGISPPPTPLSFQTMNMYPPPAAPYQQRPVGTSLSPTAAEFSIQRPGSGPWNAQVRVPTRQRSTTKIQQPAPESSSTYVAPTEPINYRRLLDRNMSCDWKYIVDKIVCNNDQQASIFLQQKLKIGTPEQKYDIVEAIISQAYPLMTNRFGNFLVQRCFEHGTPEQVIAIANAIRGNTLNLSMDAFGCHVIQKAFDSVPEEYKAIMVHELLRRIPETVIHRYACHVWQKLFELRWSDSPPQIMKYVNEALRGMWHEVALGETGSLVVQNIFENCLDEDKVSVGVPQTYCIPFILIIYDQRPCINEVLASIDVIAHGQFGNWCIQHICEHGAPADRSRAIDHILRFATEYSMDQYASKVIEKCLKIGGTDFLDRYLDRVCEGRADRPRMPLIDIAGDQFGNYLIQWILTSSNPNHREIVASHVRKHMVSLRGSKYGSRVAMLCCNPAYSTRPGPPTGMQLSRYNSNGSSNRSAYGGAYR